MTDVIFLFYDKRLEQLPDKAKEQRKAHELFFKN